MVDVGEKPSTARRAVAQGRIVMQPDTLKLIEHGGHKKGDVLGIARVAAIMAAKKTSDLIPLCHSIPVTAIEIDFRFDNENHSVYCQATVSTQAQTGIEMEALVAVQIALLTIYDMCKAVDRAMSIAEVQLIEKSGGKSGHWIRDKN